MTAARTPATIEALLNNESQMTGGGRGEFTGMRVTPETDCWRCESADVDPTSNVGLCAACTEYLRAEPKVSGGLTTTAYTHGDIIGAVDLFLYDRGEQPNILARAWEAFWHWLRDGAINLLAAVADVVLDISVRREAVRREATR
jgi:hypothetical protein